MAINDKYHHQRIEKTGLPYISNASITETRPHWVDGSHDTVCNVKGYLERRPGFPAYTADDFGGAIQRFFTWQRWDGSFYVMISYLNGSGDTIVAKLKVGTDTTFQTLLTASSSTEPFDFVEASNAVYFGNGTTMKKWDGTTVNNWGITPPASAPTTSNAASGVVPAVIGHRYIYTYGVSATGYVSDISDPSAIITTVNRQWDVTGPFCPDTQCDKVHIYRTEDGGSVYLELPNSPINNPGSGTWTIRDNAADSALLQSSPAPYPGVNAPPPGLKGFRFFAGRIWGFVGDRVWFSTFEENVTSVPVECFGQQLTNSRALGSQVLGLGITKDYILIFTTRGIQKIGGDSLNTFTLATLSRNMGVRNRATIFEYDDKCGWLNISNTIEITDGISIAQDDISLAIRPDLESVDHSLASIVAYTSGKYKWIVMSDGGADKVRVFDITLNQWNTPWEIADCEAVGAGQTAAGTFKLFLGVAGEPMAVDHAVYLDDGVAFEPGIKTNLMTITAEQPAGVGVLEYVAIERNTFQLENMAYLTDEDYRTGTYISIVGNEIDPPNRVNGTALVEKRYGANTPAAERVSLLMSWAAINSNFILYTLDLAWRRVN